jgi:CubicO group peptidase (beta-lactamase class C family)
MPLMFLKFVPLIVAALGLALGAAPAATLAAQAPWPAARAGEAPPVGATGHGSDPGTAADRFVGVHETIRHLVESDSLPSVAVAVARHGEILWHQAFGWADRERRVPATPETPYSVASISKPMTAAAVLRLAERGVLDLDRPANDYLLSSQLTGLAGDAAGATVRRLLDHTAGLPLHYAFFYAGSGYPARSTDEAIARYGILVNPPGSVHEYSNLGYGVLDRILEHLTGQGYADVMRTEVFEPLGMGHSSVGTGAGLDHAAVRYDPLGRPIPPYDFDHRGGSAVYASVLDLVRFGQAHLPRQADAPGPRLLPDTLLSAMVRIWPPGTTGQGYGLGWQVVEDDGGYRRFSHTGGMPGVTTALYVYPDEGVVVAAVTNTRDRSVLEIAERAAAVALPGYDEGLRLQRAQRTANLGSEPPVWSRRPPTALRGAWRGHVHTYEGAVPITLEIRSDGEVHVRLADEARVTLEPTAFRADGLVGRFAGPLPTGDALRHPHTLRLDLRLRDGRLAGQASAMAATEEIHFALGAYVELTQEPAQR